MNQSFKNERALILVSGGQDSITSLFWAMREFESLYAISFNYNQKHKKEIDIAKSICKNLGIPYKLVNLNFLKDILVSNLFKNSSDVNEKHQLDKNIPSSFVPYRNMLFLTIASGWASTLGIRHIVMGVCQTDYSGYADCRDEFIKSCQVTLNLAADFGQKNVIIHTPLMFLTKSEEFKLAEDLGCLDIILKKTLTCYNGVERMNEYGMGCGECPACKLREKGYNEYKRNN